MTIFIICVFSYDHLKAFLYFRVPENKNPRLLWKNLEFAKFLRLEFRYFLSNFVLFFFVYPRILKQYTAIIAVPNELNVVDFRSSIFKYK